MSMDALLVEIGTEELPPGSLRTLGEAFECELLAQLDTHNIVHGTSRWFATPRRLAVLIESVAALQADTVLEKLGPALSAAYDQDGKPSKAALGFARGCGVAFETLERTPGERGERLVSRQNIAGQASAMLLPALVEAALGALPIARRMRWGARRAEFVRPAHWVVLLHGATVVPGTLLGIATGRETRGHRVHGEARITLDTASAYEELLLRRGSVVADYEARKQSIARQVHAKAVELGGQAVVDDELLEEVCSLVEWPRALAGRFESRFLAVPAEALVSSMKRHQKYFHVTATDGALLPCFITVANIDSRDPAKVIEGNERVIRPRLADAAFFFGQDQQVSLLERRERLRSIVFQKDLGSVWDKTERVARLAQWIGTELGADPALCARAARISKSDLVSEMVQEFAELQGVMGSYYALHDGEDPAVARALTEQYLPRHAGDELAQSTLGQVLAIADRIDTLTGIFGIGQPPTGSKDPFALRRAALGVLRTLLERQLPLDLQPLLEHAAEGFATLAQRASVVDSVREYMLERFRALYSDAGISVECFLAVQARGITRALDFDRRVRAVAAFAELPEAAALAIANKRVANILAKQGADGSTVLAQQLLREPAELELAQALERGMQDSAPMLENGDYAGVLRVLAQLRTPIDDFFEQVLVACEDDALRLNRLALLGQLRNAFLAVADISLLAVST
ncbi:MAG: glycine--tRNA ligase subunit beta [Pseudomonadales bacterium]|jgi:glycyl-tRNA synthetase beta chain|nr:glycine--tRNA ligase subunit beta [Gammaproteobacteria bacterium]MBK6582968.1 glycine--tRNA ligase subunit beta [Gammaproteobacteria bacterium]MBK9665986.1 glycine--tRNA ligase subunit beta [Gammaproteobacteria bacterium]MBP6051807.1 glycine--tRNA ligase subunit beta [Pseudomonadales bacterium]MBP6227312.1 glycine--tRNA ligase subunit beta [Pseudomonadales bacterium]